MEQPYISLKQLNDYISDVLDRSFEGAFWLKTEISQINFHRSGHCYLEFVEQSGNSIIAKARATIWRSALTNIRYDLGDDFENILARGKEVLVQASVNFHAVYGLSISIHKVDPSFALGELEKRKQETLDRLEKEDLLELNASLPLPTVVQKIALIASEGSSGHQDFMKQIEQNAHGVMLHVELYHASVQGADAEHDICERLDDLMEGDHDVIVIIRGGGSKLDLEAFNSYEIARRIALHNIPVITGIGHETDVSVADIVAHKSLKTPTAAGVFLIDRAIEFLRSVGDHFLQIMHRYELTMRSAQAEIESTQKHIIQNAVHTVQKQKNELHRKGNRVTRFTRSKISAESGKLDLRRDILANRPFEQIRQRRSRDQMTEQMLTGRSRSLLMEKSNALGLQSIALKNKSLQKLRDTRGFIQKNQVLLHNVHPDRILQRGFSVVRKSDKAIIETTKLKEGDLLEIELFKRKIYAQYLNEEPEWKNLKTLLTKKPQKS